MNTNVSQKIFQQLQEQVNKANKLNKPIEPYVKQQITLLEEVHDNFVQGALTKNKDLADDLNFAEVQIKQLQAIASLCKKIGLSTEKYDNKIREIRIQHLGADFVAQHYKK